MSSTHFFGGEFFGGEFFSETAATVLIRSGGGPTWQDEIEARHRKRQLEARLAKYGREEKKLVVQQAKIERKIEAEKRQSHPIDGILVKYLEVSDRIAETKVEIRNIHSELMALSKFLGDRLQSFDDDEDDIEALLLDS